MAKVLIVDDEPLVCVGLNSMLDWGDLGIEVSGTARNGQEAEDMIALIKPDIVIADIKMPVMNGLELVEKCADRYGRIPLFIILTSFDDFDYARRALKTRVVDYLIKLELSPEILRGSIEKALKTLSELRQLESIEDESRAGGAHFIRERFFLMLYNNLFETERQYFGLMEESGVDFPRGCFVAAICELTKSAGGAAPSDNMVKQYENTMRIANETISGTYRCYITPLDPQSFCVALCLGDVSRNEDPPLLMKTLANMRDMLHGYLNVSIRVAVGGIVADPRRLTESYMDAKRLCPELTDTHPIRFSEKRQGHRRHLIANVQKYVREHIHERIPLNEVAEEFGLSPGYLSQLFAKTTGKSYVEFVTESRIAAAKEMLAGGKLKIYEVAELLCFGNAFYFSKVFKKIEGVSPREYQKKLFGTNT